MEIAMEDAPSETGILVTNVTPGSVIDKCGIKDNDIILQVRETSVRHARDFVFAIEGYIPGDVCPMLIQRGSKKGTHTFMKLPRLDSFVFAAEKMPPIRRLAERSEEDFLVLQETPEPVVEEEPVVVEEVA